MPGHWGGWAPLVYASGADHVKLESPSILTKKFFFARPLGGWAPWAPLVYASAWLYGLAQRSASLHTRYINRLNLGNSSAVRSVALPYEYRQRPSCSAGAREAAKPRSREMLLGQQKPRTNRTGTGGVRNSICRSTSIRRSTGSAADNNGFVFFIQSDCSGSISCGSKPFLLRPTDTLLIFNSGRI